MSRSVQILLLPHSLFPLFVDLQLYGVSYVSYWSFLYFQCFLLKSLGFIYGIFYQCVIQFKILTFVFNLLLTLFIELILDVSVKDYPFDSFLV